MADRYTLGVNRRGFLAGAAAGGAALTATAQIAGCKKEEKQEDYDWDEEFEVLIVGAGGAGLTAAVEALEAGSSVVLFEKAEEAGGSTALSGGVIQAAGTSVQQGQGIQGDTPEDHAEYYNQAGEGVPDAELVDVMTENAPAALEFMVALGLDYSGVYGVGPIPTVDADLMVDRIHVPGDGVEVGRGVDHIDVLLARVEALGGELRKQATVDSLVEDPKEGIVGVLVTIDGKQKAIRARRAVVLASGGFDHNTELARAYSPQQLWELETGTCWCAPTNTGDGMLMGMDVGADLAGMGGTIGVPAVTMGAGPLAPGLPAIGGIWVNRYGQRFVNENAHYAFAMRAVFDEESHEAWAVFDQKVAKLGGTVLGGIWGAWSEDLSEELASGKVVMAKTLSALADAIGVNAKELERTMLQWNLDVQTSTDSVFGRTAGLDALDTAPFYATRVTSVNLGSIGGLRTDKDTQVIDLWGQPIKRLYAAGMVAGGYIGPYYPGSGTAILGTVVFGRIAGQKVAAEAALEAVLG